jgi:anti-sigma regulatory factor (Ser/Thr protein kinase)
MTNIIKLHNNKELENSITEIRIEEVRDYENNEFYYYIYCVKDTGQRIEVGRSRTKPQCYKQIAIYN